MKTFKAALLNVVVIGGLVLTVIFAPSFFFMVLLSVALMIVIWGM